MRFSRQKPSFCKRSLRRAESRVLDAIEALENAHKRSDDEYNALRQEALEARLRTPVNNIEYFPPNFEGLVLGCIDADFCK